MTKKLNDYLSYRQYFNPADMWDKIAGVAKKAGAKVIYGVLLLYYTATDPATPAADKAKIYGAIGYFILPLDLVPDLMPVVGFSDDLAAITWALKAVWNNITPEIHTKARRKLETWFGDVKDSELKIL
ncbi:YkvA family protein [uncultured Muribaculum sp.]|uniref:YkvA family protein n=1 Tax=uncultured Muribaculum sp. TaxID=1918613 RepID=UPI0026E54E4B|nr:DUF1232 domain-containing protein [uncultured Muribaculum sp.]